MQEGSTNAERMQGYLNTWTAMCGEPVECDTAVMLAERTAGRVTRRPPPATHHLPPWLTGAWVLVWMDAWVCCVHVRALAV